VKTLVLGIGNSLLTDEGVGVHAIRYLQEHYAELPDTTYLDGGTLSFTLAGMIEDNEQLIVIDATELKAEAGTVRMFVDADMDDFLGKHRKLSVHEVGLLDLMSIARLAQHYPKRRALIGIQPASVDWGEIPTPAVNEAIPAVCKQTIELIEQWRT